MKNISLLSILLVILSAVNCFETRALSLSMPPEAQLNRIEKASSAIASIALIAGMQFESGLTAKIVEGLFFGSLICNVMINITSRLKYKQKKAIIRMAPAMIVLMGVWYRDESKDLSYNSFSKYLGGSGMIMNALKNACDLYSVCRT